MPIERGQEAHLHRQMHQFLDAADPDKLKLLDEQIDQAVTSKLTSIGEESIRHAAPLHMPLNYESLEQHVNHLAIHALLHLPPTNQWSDKLPRSSEDVIRYGMMAMYISPAIVANTPATQPLGTLYLLNISVSELASLFDIPLVEMYSPQPGFEISRPGPFASLLNDMTSRLNAVGARLKQLNYPSLGHFIVDLVRQKPELARNTFAFMDQLVTVIPQFADNNNDAVNGMDKLQWLVEMLQSALGGQYPQLFAFPDLDHSLVSSGDPVIMKQLTEGLAIDPTLLLPATDDKNNRLATMCTCSRLLDRWQQLTASNEGAAPLNARQLDRLLLMAKS